MVKNKNENLETMWKYLLTNRIQVDNVDRFRNLSSDDSETVRGDWFTKISQLLEIHTQGVSSLCPKRSAQ